MNDKWSDRVKEGPNSEPREEREPDYDKKAICRGRTVIAVTFKYKV